MKPILSIWTAILLFSNLAYAYEPPYTHPSEAIEKCQIALIGRITEIKEISNGKNVSEAIAKIKIEIFLIGLENYKKNEIYLKFSSRYFVPIPYHGFPAEFFISEVYLFVINRPIQKGNAPLFFNPSYENKIDLAYQFSNDPDFSLTDINKPQKLLSIYTSQVFSGIRIVDIVKWSKRNVERAQQSLPAERKKRAR